MNSDVEASNGEDIVVKVVGKCVSLDSGEIAFCVGKEERKACFLQRKAKIPKLLVHDIRKLYCAMMMNVFNSADYSLLFGFIDTYFVKNVQYQLSKYCHSGALKDFTLNINGVFEVAKYWYSIFRMSPDNVLRLYDVCFNHTTGALVCKASKECTHIYEFNKNSSYDAPYLFVDKSYGRDVLYANDKSAHDFVVGRKDRVEGSVLHLCPPDTACIMRSIIDSVDFVVSRVPLRKTPLSIKADGTFVIMTDENKRITRVEVIFSFQ